jgi:2-polyprenyl-3-methyl-5-hydroxy-6-metoxy-1,4-benzoquinol methylase
MACIICGSETEKTKFKYQGTNFKKCTGCGLVRTIPFPTEKGIYEHYERRFRKGNYKTLYLHLVSYSIVYKGFIRLLKKRVGTLAGKRILDVGCFCGDFLDLAHQDGADVFGIELQKDACEIARKKHGDRIRNCSFEQASFNQHFDIITMFGLIEHTVHPEILIASAARWLRKGGVLALQTPNTMSFLAKIMWKYWPPYIPIEHIHYFSASNIAQFLKSNGFENVKCTPHIKPLTIRYLYDMLETFGREFRWILKPFVTCMHPKFQNLRLPLYGGEMIVTAYKSENIP